MHVRAQIRGAIAAALVGLPLTGDRVHASRVYPISAGRLPGLCVYTNDEQAENDESMGRFTAQRELTVTVEAYAQASTSLDDELDEIAADVETALAAADKLGGLVRAWFGPTTTEIEFGDPGAEIPVAVLRMEFRYLYMTAQGAPGVSA